MKKIFGLISILIAFASSALSQQQPIKLSGRKLLEWQVEVAANAYALNASELNRADYVVSLEKLTVLICMPRLYQDFVFAGNPTDPACLEKLEKLSEIDSENPLVICVRNGTRSANCAASFKSQLVEVFNTYSGARSEATSDRMSIGLAFKLEQDRSAEELSKLWQELSSQESYMAGRSEEELTKFRQQTLKPLYARLLKASCGVSRLNFEKRKDSTAVTVFRLGPTPTAAHGSDAAKLLQQLENAYSKATPTAATTKEVVTRRVRYISDACKRAAESLRIRDPKNAAAICSIYGSYSPYCLTAAIVERQAMAEKNPSKKADSATTVSENTESNQLFESF